MGADESNSDLFDGVKVGIQVGNIVGLMQRGAESDWAFPKKWLLKNTAVSDVEDTAGGTLQRHLSTSEHVPLFVPSTFSLRRWLSK